MKKGYLIPLLIIAILAGYLVLQKKDRRHYTLPEPPAVDMKTIDRLTVEKENQTFEFTRTKSGWAVSEQAYPADSAAVEQMLNVMSHLTLSALVSEKQDVARYELDPSHCLTVTAFQGDVPALSIKIGKTAPTFNHTFVMLGNDPHIYQAKDSIRSYFNKSLNEFRDRQVLAFQEDDIHKITIQTPEKQVTLTAQQPEDNEKQEKKPAFRYEDGASPNPKTVSNLLHSLTDLTCDQYMTDMKKADLETAIPNLAVFLENGSQRVLKLFGQDKDDSVPSISSMNDYVSP